jgi:hypothetical protein
MFRWLNKQGVESSSGFVLQSVDRYGYHYREGGKTMRIDVEPRRIPGGDYYEEVSEKSFSVWLPPHASEVVTAEERERLRANVRDALSFMGIKYRFA